MASPRRKLTPVPASTPALGVGSDHTPHVSEARGKATTATVAAQKPVLKDFNFKVPEEFKNRFAQKALDDKISRVELLRRAFAAYKEESE